MLVMLINFYFHSDILQDKHK